MSPNDATYQGRRFDTAAFAVENTLDGESNQVGSGDHHPCQSQER